MGKSRRPGGWGLGVGGLCVSRGSFGQEKKRRVVKGVGVYTARRVF